MSVAVICRVPAPGVGSPHFPKIHFDVCRVVLVAYPFSLPQ